MPEPHFRVSDSEKWCVPEESVMVEDVLIALGEKVGFENLISTSRMNRAVVVFVKEQRRQVFMFLESPENTLNISFPVKHEGRTLMIYASTGNMKCFECGDIGHKRLTCPHKGRKEEAVTDTMEENREPVVNQEGTTEHVEFRCFGEHWKTKKNLRQWWDVGKVEIKLLCQQHTANSSPKGTLHQKKKELGSYLDERVKGALVRSRFTTLEDMDAPSAFFFNLARSTAQHRQMVCLRLPDGRVTMDITEMRHQTYCIPHRSIFDNLFLVRDVLDILTTPSSKGLTVTTSPLLGLTVNMPLSLVPNSDHVLFPETGSDHAPSTDPSCDHIPFTGPYSDHALFHGTDSDHTPFTGTDSDHALFPGPDSDITFTGPDSDHPPLHWA
ncbi:hypothetical protein QTP86_006554 [Hemibagrus guttatus]|nr:hypothetical protein QTP86_006554 [Hemibagrus guttatus]